MKYDSRFTADEKQVLSRMGVIPQKVNQYPKRLSGYDILWLASQIPPDIVNEYPQEYTAHQMHLLFKNGFNPEITRKCPWALDLVLYLFDTSRIDGSFIHRVAWARGSEYYNEKILGPPYWRTLCNNIAADYKDYSYLGSGWQSIVLFNKAKRTAYKVSWDIDYERSLLQKINKRNTQNFSVVKMIGEVNPLVISLEYISGASLYQYLSEKRIIDFKRLIAYSSGILNGLLELRQAGIWHHRDIRPANIMIDEEKDRAVIIDLGIATTDKDALAKDNRRFGSPTGRVANDLNSLGQIIYKMATGEHIFAESKSMERTTYADKLKDHRDWIYEDQERLRPYLETVELKVEDPTLRDIVTFCLRSEGADEDYQTLEQRFNDAA